MRELAVLQHDFRYLLLLVSRALQQPLELRFALGFVLAVIHVFEHDMIPKLRVGRVTSDEKRLLDGIKARLHVLDSLENILADEGSGGRNHWQVR